jgi:hypothetical protein
MKTLTAINKSKVTELSNEEFSKINGGNGYTVSWHHNYFPSFETRSAILLRAIKERENSK